MPALKALSLDEDAKRSFSLYAEALPLACMVLSINNGTVLAVNSRAKTLLGKSWVGCILSEHSAQPEPIRESLKLFAGSHSPVPATWTLTLEKQTFDLKVSGARLPVGSSRQNDLILVTLNKKAPANQGLFGELTVQLNSIRRERHRLLQDNKLLEARVADRTAQLQIQNSELDTLNASLQHFVSMVSHDLAGPVRRIHSFSTLLLEELNDTKLNGNAPEFLRYLEEAAALLRQMLDGITRLSNINVDVDRWQTIDLDPLVETVAADIQGLNPNVDIEIKAESLGEVFGDPGQVQQLVRNLVGNAIKFRVPGKTAKIHLRSEISAKRNQRELIVRDEGLGISSNDIEKVLRPFVRGSGAEAQPGTGLGLAMCQRICQLHKGSLWIEHSVHMNEATPSGTEIRLRLPVGRTL